jgi:nitronate monooxygenase
VRDTAADRAVAVNLLMPFVRRAHVDVCVETRIEVAVMAFGLDRALIVQLTESGVFVFVMVGTAEQARRAIASGADGLIAQGVEAGGHLAGDTRAMALLPSVLGTAGARPFPGRRDRRCGRHPRRAGRRRQRRCCGNPLRADK